MLQRNSSSSSGLVWFGLFAHVFFRLVWSGLVVLACFLFLSYCFSLHHRVHTHIICVCISVHKFSWHGTRPFLLCSLTWVFLEREKKYYGYSHSNTKLERFCHMRRNTQQQRVREKIQEWKSGLISATAAVTQADCEGSFSWNSTQLFQVFFGGVFFVVMLDVC